MKLKSIFMIVLLTALLSATTAMAATYFVRPDGSDNNSGLINDASGAFRTIQYAANVAIAGDVVEVQEGVYNEALAISSPATSTDRILFKGVGKVTLDGQNVLNNAIYSAGSNVDFYNFEIKNYTEFAFYFYSYGNHIDNCDIHDNNMAIEGYGEALSFGGQVFTNCKFYNHHAPSGYVIRPYKAAQGLTFDNCDFYQNQGMVIWFAHTEGFNTIKRCRFSTNGTAVTSGDLVGTVRVYNSVFYNNGVAFSTGNDRYGSEKDLKNNIIINNGNGIIKSSSDSGVVIDDYNVVWSNNTNYSNVSPGANDRTVDPKLVNPGAADFSLQPFSPAIDKGFSLGDTFYGAATDIGSVEKLYPSTRSELAGTQGGSGWFKSVVTATITSDIPTEVAEIRASINGAAEISNPGNILSADVYEEGTNFITFYAVDKAGIPEALPNKATINIDSMAPNTVAVATGDMGELNRFRSNVQVTLSPSDSVSGVNYSEYSLDNATWNIYYGAVTISTEGNNTVYFRSTDRAGNTESSKSITFTIDKTAPTVVSTVPVNSSTGVVATAPIVITYNEYIAPGSAYDSITLKKGSASIALTKTISGNTLTITPTSALGQNTQYTLTIPANAINDTAGNGGALLSLGFRTMK